MIIGIAGIIAGGAGSGFPAYGTLLSSACTETTVYDYNMNSYTGYYNSHRVYADGYGGTYSTDDLNLNGCWYPYGFTDSAYNNQVDISWNGCSNNGVLSNAGTFSYSHYSDGSGGWITSEGYSWNYSTGYVIYDNMVDCRVVFTQSASPWYYTETYGGTPDPYGTKYGTPYWDSGNSALYQSIADGNGGTIQVPWDGQPPYPTSGTQIASPSYGCGYTNDAINASWYLCFYTYTYADGNNGSYYTSVIDGYYPNGYATGGYQTFTDEYDYSWSIWDNNYNNMYPWKYGYPIADGMGGSSRSYSYPTYYGIPMSDWFYDQYSNYGRIYSDGNGGFYFST